MQVSPAGGPSRAVDQRVNALLGARLGRPRARARPAPSRKESSGRDATCHARGEYCHNGAWSYTEGVRHQAEGAELPGVHHRHRGPRCGTRETAILQEKGRRVPRFHAFGVRDPLVWLGKREKYCHNGGMAFAHQHGGRAAEGCQPRPRSAHGPCRGSLEAVLLQGKGLVVRDSRPLGAGMDSSGFFFQREYCHNGGMAPPTSTAGEPSRGARPEGSAIGIMARCRGPLEAVLLQGKRLGVHESAPLGAAMDSSACSTPRQVLPQTAGIPSSPPQPKGTVLRDQDGVHGPFADPEGSVFAGEKVWGPEVALWGQRRTRLPATKTASRSPGRP
jgi:hypothetical protein